MPRSLSQRVLVEHAVYGTRKRVLRSRLAGLGPRWKRVPDKKKRPPTPSPVVETPTVEPAAEPDTTTKEE